MLNPKFVRNLAIGVLGGATVGAAIGLVATRGIAITKIVAEEINLRKKETN